MSQGVSIASIRFALDGALGILERGPDTHTTGALARDNAGNRVKPTSPYAAAWDVNGAVLRACRVDRFDDVATAAHNLVQEVAVELGHRSVHRCNDELGREGAIRMLRGALLDRLERLKAARGETAETEGVAA